MSDHRLVKAQFLLGVSRRVPVTYNFGPLKSMDYSAFEQSILAATLFSAPADTVDTFTDQLKYVIKSTLNELATLRTVTRATGGKHVNRFLSHEAICAKRKLRRLERCWKKTGADPDRLAYRRQCRTTNRPINEWRIQHYAERIADMTADSKKRWSAVNELLHTNNRPTPPPPKEARQQCDSISAFFTTKIRCMKEKDTIASRLVGQVTDPFTFDKPHVGPQQH